MTHEHEPLTADNVDQGEMNHPDGYVYCGTCLEPLGKTILQYADEIMAAIHEDMENPHFRNSKGERMPRDVGTFSELHDYTDANMYLIDFIPYAGPDCICEWQKDAETGGWIGGQAPNCKYHDAWDKYMEFTNLVSDEVDYRLREEAIVLNTGDRCKCGMLVRFQGGNPGNGHWVHLPDQSHQCDPCYFCIPYRERQGHGPTWKPDKKDLEDWS